MAVLSKHGSEVARVVYRATFPTRPEDYDRRVHGLTEVRYDYHVSFRSDGHVLRRAVCLDCHLNEPEGSPRRKADFGWKLWLKNKRKKGDPQMRESQRKLAERMTRNLPEGSLIDSTTAVL